MMNVNHENNRSQNVLGTGVVLNVVNSALIVYLAEVLSRNPSYDQLNLRVLLAEIQI